MISIHLTVGKKKINLHNNYLKSFHTEFNKKILNTYSNKILKQNQILLKWKKEEYNKIDRNYYLGVYDKDTKSKQKLRG